MKVTFKDKTKVAENIYTFTFNYEKKPSYIAGQFIELYLPHKDKDNRGEKRWFTLSSSPTEEVLSITTKIIPEGKSTFKQTLANLKPGDEVAISSPMGDFVLPKDPNIPLVFFAGGIGCTPFRSITKYLIDQKEQRNITMLYNATSPEDIAFKSDFAYYGKNFRSVTGEHLTAQKILKFADSSDKRLYFYLSGPEPMIEILNNDLKKLGIHKKHIHTDFFPGYTENSI